LDVLVTLYVGDVVPERKGDVIERKLESMLERPSDAIGSRVSLVSREKIPFLGSHWKYRLPETAPSFLPKIVDFPSESESSKVPKLPNLLAHLTRFQPIRLARSGLRL
jgi:hypothetical protein